MESWRSCCSRLSWTFDVFSSFRKVNACLIFFGKDDTTLLLCKAFVSELYKAMKESIFAVVTFSKNYADSSWCLDEVLKIIESPRRRSSCRFFYSVDPSDVRKQKGQLREEKCWWNSSRYLPQHENKLPLGRDVIQEADPRGNL